MDNRVCSLCGKIHSEAAPKSDTVVVYHDTSMDYIRDYLAGFIGGCDVASKATDKEVALLCQLQDDKAKVYNRYISIDNSIKVLQSMIKERR